MLQQHEKVMKLSGSGSPAALSHCAVTWQAAALMVTRGTQSTLHTHKHTHTHTHTVPQKCCRQSVLHNGNMFPSRDPESLQEEKPLCQKRSVHLCVKVYKELMFVATYSHDDVEECEESFVEPSSVPFSTITWLYHKGWFHPLQLRLCSPWVHLLPQTCSDVNPYS